MVDKYNPVILELGELIVLGIIVWTAYLLFESMTTAFYFLMLVIFYDFRQDIRRIKRDSE